MEWPGLFEPSLPAQEYFISEPAMTVGRHTRPHTRPYGTLYATLYTCSARVLHVFWTRFGRVLDVFWTCSGRVLDVFWTCSGRVLDVFWTCSGRVLDVRRSATRIRLLLGYGAVRYVLRRSG